MFAYTFIGREHKKLSEEIQRLRDQTARLQDDLKVSQSRTETMKGNRDMILEDYSVQSVTLTSMTDRAVIAECRLAETMNDLERETETVAKVTRNSDLCEKSKEFLLDRLEGYDKCRADAKRYKADAELWCNTAKRYKADAERYTLVLAKLKGYESCKADAESYKCDAERFERDAERFERGLQHYKEKARVAEEDCMANLFDFDKEKKALLEEVEALKARLEADRLEDAKLKALERKIEELEMDIQDLTDGQETAKAAYEMEIKSDKATINGLRTELNDITTELEDTKEELDGYKEDNDERTNTIKGLLKLRKQQQTELGDLKKQLEDLKKEVEDLKSQLEDSKSQLKDSKKEIEDLEGQLEDSKKELAFARTLAKFAGAGQPDPLSLPSASGTGQAPGNMSNYSGNSPLLLRPRRGSFPGP